MPTTPYIVCKRGLAEAPPACDQAAAWIPAISSLDRLADGVALLALDRREGRDARSATELGPLVTQAAALADGSLTTPEDASEVGRRAVVLYDAVTAGTRARET